MLLPCGPRPLVPALLAAALCIACSDKNGDDSEDQGASDVDPANTLASYRLDLLTTVDFRRVLSLTEAQSPSSQSVGSSSACQLKRDIDKALGQILTQVQQTFCNGKPIVFDIGYHIVQQNADRKEESYLKATKNDDGSLTISTCSGTKKESKHHSKINTTGDGTGRVDMIQISTRNRPVRSNNASMFRYTFDKRHSDPQLVSIKEDFVNRYAYGMGAMQFSADIRADHSGDILRNHYSHETEFKSDIPNLSTPATEYFSQALTRFDAEFGHSLTTFGSPLDPDYPGPSTEEDFFSTVSDLSVSATDTDKFLAGGTLAISEVDLPPRIDANYNIDPPADMWPCDEIDEVVEIHHENPADAMCFGPIKEGIGDSDSCSDGAYMPPESDDSEPDDDTEANSAAGADDANDKPSK